MACGRMRVSIVASGGQSLYCGMWYSKNLFIACGTVRVFIVACCSVRF